MKKRTQQYLQNRKVAHKELRDIEYLSKRHVDYNAWVQHVNKMGELLGDKRKFKDWYLKECYECSVTVLGVYDNEEEF